MSLLENFYIFITALFAALIMVPFLRKWALHSGTLDTPDDRKVHTGAIPRLGGVAIAMAFIVSLLLHGNLDSQIRGIMAGSLVMFFTGLVDDLHGISPKAKFIGEIGASLITITVGHLYITHLGNLFGTGDIVLPLWVAIPFTLFAVVGLINAINLIDGLDGLAGGVSMIVLFTFGLLGYISGNVEVMVIASALLGGVLGFLKFNFYPARIFMGDAGSLTVGFTLAFLAILLTQTEGSGISPAVPLVVLGLPIIDTVWVMTRRVMRGTSPFAADKTHVHHKFLDFGFGHRFTVIIIYGISLFWALMGVVCRHCPEYVLLFFYLSVSVISYAGLRHIRYYQERFQWLLTFDSHLSWRSSKVYQDLVRRFRPVEFLLLGFLLTYVALASIWGRELNSSLLQIALALVICMVALIYFSKNLRTDFNLLSFYFVALLCTALLYSRPLEVDVIRPLVDALFASIAVLTLLRFTFGQPDQFFLSGADLLIFGVNILFAVLASQVQDGSPLPGILARSVLLYLAIKLVIAGSENRVRPLAWVFFSSIMIMVGRVVLI